MSEKLNENNGIIHDRKTKGLNDLQQTLSHNVVTSTPRLDRDSNPHHQW
jgi:hypothetical protein